MAIFSNPLFATYSVYGRNASIVVKLFTFSFKHCPSLLILESKFVFADLQYQLFCFDSCVFFVFMSFSMLGDKNFKSKYEVRSVRPCIRKMSELQVVDWKLEAQAVVQLCRKKCDKSSIVVSFIYEKCYNKLHKSFVGSREVQCP